MPGPNGERCDACYFAIDSNLDEPGTEFWCYRFPPSQPFRELGKPDWDVPYTNPNVYPSQWCGEFKTKP